MDYRRSIRLFALLGMALFALAACNVPAQTGAGTAGTAGSTPTGTAAAAPTAGKTPTGGSPTPGAVTLVLDKSSYGPNQPIEVTIKNGLKTMIWAADHQTDCMLVQLQHQENGAWRAVGTCRLEIATRILPLNPGSSTPQVLAPGTGLNATGPWPAGTYRVAFAYHAGNEEGAGQGQVVYSATFTVS
jgi:hypothetical protein